MVTLAMRPDFTSSRNCEYSIGACAAWRVLKLIEHGHQHQPDDEPDDQVLSMLFKYLLLTLRCAKGILQGQQAARHHISFARFTRDAEGFLTHHLPEFSFQTRQDLAEGFAMKCLDQETPSGFSVLRQKSIAAKRQARGPGLVDIRDSREVRREVREHDVRPHTFQLATRKSAAITSTPVDGAIFSNHGDDAPRRA